MIIRKIFIIIFTLLMCCQMTAQQMVTLEEIIDLATQYNFGLRIATNNREAAENSAKWGNVGLLPRLDVNGNYNYGESSTSAEYQAIPPVETEAAGSRVYGGSVTASYTLFDGFRNQTNFKKSKANFRLNDLAYRQELENMMVNIISAYYDLVRLQEDEKIAIERFEITKVQLRQIEGRQAYGQATEADRLNVLTAYNSDSTAMVRARLNIRRGVLNLNTLIGKKELGEKDVAATELILKPNLTFEELLENAQQKNIALLQAQTSVLLSDLDVKLAKANRFPRVNLSGAYSLNDQKNEMGFLLANQNLGWNGGATASYNIFNGSQTSTNIKNAKLARENQVIALERNRFQVEQNLMNAWLDYENNKSLLAIGENNVAIGKQSLDRTQRANRSGQASNLEVRDAQRAYAEAQNNLLTTRLNVKLSEFEVLRIAGMLIGE